MSFCGLVLSTFTWHVCTSGSDQMAIQRYLATRDARSARRVLGVCLLADTVVLGLLSVLGLALLAYFTYNPPFVGKGEMLSTGADKLFPTFICSHLPVGAKGLVIAALLAAAMSSLSSGINSASSVIVVDGIERLQLIRLNEASHVRFARYVSVLVGVLVVGMSLNVGLVKGNLLELCYKVPNLLVAPLFMLFFMAMFVPWATSFGTIVGALVSITVAVLIGFGDQLFPGRKAISFLWIMPASFIAGVVAGTAASLGQACHVALARWSNGKSKM
jgi:SSS family solute:Na+ symporter